MEENKVLAKRMYFFVPYNISPIQQGIQAGHAALEYARKFGTTDLFKEFVSEHKTWIILNGGTTNNARTLDGMCKGTLDQIRDVLAENDIKFAQFHEPDLNDALTAVCFIVDERVFNTTDYPSFDDFYDDMTEGDDMGNTTYSDVEKAYNEFFGEKTRFLRDLILTKKLA
jgi:hypothetical protein